MEVVMLKKFIKDAKRIAHQKGFKFLRWNQGFIKVNGIEYRYPVMEFIKERSGLEFINPTIHKSIAINPFAQRIIW